MTPGTTRARTTIPMRDPNRRINRELAVTWAGLQILNPLKDWTNRCQEFTRRSLGVGGGFPSAITAWRGTAKADRSPSRTPPAGVPCYYSGGKYGHAVLSAGDGFVYSTDIKRRGKVDKVPLHMVETRWGYRYLGWSRTINGVRIYGKDPA